MKPIDNHLIREPKDVPEEKEYTDLEELQNREEELNDAKKDDET